MAASRTPSLVAGDQLNSDLTLDQRKKPCQQDNRADVAALDQPQRPTRNPPISLYSSVPSLFGQSRYARQYRVQRQSRTAANPDRVFQLPWKLGVVESGA